MATQAAVPLDEIQYRREEIINWWLTDPSVQGGRPHEWMDENMMHRYLSESPFFDYLSKNGIIMDQSRTVQSAFDLAKDRKAFEAELALRPGLEYMIVGDPLRTQTAEKNMMYVIRKQQRDRVKRADGVINVDLTTLGTYYSVGENMYQAPCVGDILGNRLLSAANSLSKFFDTAADLPSFSPTAGYHYLPHVSARPASLVESSHGSPSRSREGSVVPGVDIQSSRSESVPLPDSQASSHASIKANTQDSALLAQSFKMALEFGDEYMDENPLLGEPGHFHFTSTAAFVKKRKADEEAAVLAAKARAQSQNSADIIASKAAKPPSPPAIMMEAKTVAKGDKDRRVSKLGERAKRKKSRAVNAGSTPATPGTGAGTATSFGP